MEAARIVAPEVEENGHQCGKVQSSEDIDLLLNSLFDLQQQTMGKVVRVCASGIWQLIGRSQCLQPIPNFHCVIGAHIRMFKVVIAIVAYSGMADPERQAGDACCLPSTPKHCETDDDDRIRTFIVVIAVVAYTGMADPGRQAGDAWFLPSTTKHCETDDDHDDDDDKHLDMWHTCACNKDDSLELAQGPPAQGSDCIILHNAWCLPKTQEKVRPVQSR